MEPNLNTIPPPPPGFVPVAPPSSDVPPPPPGFVMHDTSGGGAGPDTRAWYEKPASDFIPQSLKQPVADFTSGIAKNPVVQETADLVSKGPIGSIVRGVGKASDVLINKPLSYLFEKSGVPTAVEKTATAVAPLSIPRLLGLETSTPEQDVAFGKQAGDTAKNIFNTAAPFALGPALKATGIGKFFPKYGAARTAAEEAATAMTRGAEGDLSKARNFAGTQGSAADDAANLAREAEIKANSARAAAESTPVPEADPMVRQLQQEAQNAAAVAEAARVRLEKAQQATTAIPKQAGTSLQGQVAGALKPIETGPAYKQSFDVAKAGAKKEVGAAYKNVETLAGTDLYDATPVANAVDDVLAEYGLTKKALPTTAQAAAVRLKKSIADPVQLEDEFYQQALPILQARQAAYAQTGQIPSVPGSLFAEIMSGGKSHLTIPEMIADRQRIRAFTRAAGDTGDVNLARQFQKIETGYTQSIEAANPPGLEKGVVAKVLGQADALYRDTYAPYYGFKAPGSKIAQKTAGAAKGTEGAVDATEAIFPKKSTRGVDTSTETARRITQSIGPDATATMGKAFLSKRVEEASADGFDPAKFQKVFSQYNPETLDIALGGTQARKDIQGVFDAFNNAKQEAVRAVDTLEIANVQAKAAGKAVTERSTQVSDLFKAKTGAAADLAQADAKAAAEQAKLSGKAAGEAQGNVGRAEKSLTQAQSQAEADLAKPHGAVERVGAAVSHHPWMGGIMLIDAGRHIVQGNVLAAMGEAALGGLLISSNGLSTLLMSSTGRTVLTGLSKVTRGSPQALIYASQANAILDSIENSKKGSIKQFFPGRTQEGSKE